MALESADGAAFDTAASDTAAFDTRAFDTAAYVYPWDVVGDPAAPELLAGLGIRHVVLAALYHATRALTPRHPAHRIVVAEHTAAYFAWDAAPWLGAALRPPAQTWQREADPFGSAAEDLASAGLPAHAWVVVNHVDPRPGAYYAPVVINAYGDVYPWALCPARDEVRDYAVRLAGQVAGRADVAGIEFEACGWYGFDHLHAHDKIAAVPLDQAEQFLFSLCFCAACQTEYRASAIDPAELRAVVRTALDAAFDGTRPRGAHQSAGPEPSGIEALLGPDLAAAALGMRGRVADRLRAEVVEAVRAQRSKADFPVLFHGNPRPYRSTAFTGLDPATLPDGADGMVVNCWGTAADAVETVQLATTAGRTDLRVAAGVLAVAGMDASPEQTRAVVEAVRSAGASGVRIYHAGLAAAADLALIRDLVASTQPVRGLPT